MLQTALLLVVLAAKGTTGQSCIARPDEIIPSRILVEAKQLADWVAQLRRQLHQTPELFYELPVTSQVVQSRLAELDINHTTHVPYAVSGVIAQIGTGKPPFIALRTDMDGLPIKELNEDPYISTIPGNMHACGHDAHMAMLLGAARILKKHEAKLPGTVRLLFQPAEEGGAGAIGMIKSGALDDVHSVFGLHVWPALATGVVASKPGPIFGAESEFEVVFHGVGGHAAMPGKDSFRDPVVAAAATIMALQSIPNRELDQAGGSLAIVSVTRMEGSKGFTSVPQTATIGGTLRSMTESDHTYLRARVRDMALGTATVYRVNATVTFTDDTDECMDASVPVHFPGGCSLPALINDELLYNSVRQSATELLGTERVRVAAPTTAGEDFAYYTRHVPSCFALLGVGNKQKNTTYGLHHPRFQIDEDALAIGVALHASHAIASLFSLTCAK